MIFAVKWSFPNQRTEILAYSQAHGSLSYMLNSRRFVIIPLLPLQDRIKDVF